MPINITVQTKEIVSTSIFSSSSPRRRHFSMGCQKMGLRPQTLKVDRYIKTVDRSSSFGSIFGPSWIPLIDLARPAQIVSVVGLVMVTVVAPAKCPVVEDLCLRLQQWALIFALQFRWREESRARWIGTTSHDKIKRVGAPSHNKNEMGQK